MSIQGMDIERVSTYKYMDVHLNNKLDWSHHTNTLYRKAQNRLFRMRRLRSFGEQGKLFRTFFVCVVPSAIFNVLSQLRTRSDWTG